MGVPLVFFLFVFFWWGAKTPAEATETLTEVTNSVRKPTRKNVRAVSGNISDCRGNVRGEDGELFTNARKKCILSITLRDTKQELQEHGKVAGISHNSRIFRLR